MGLQRGDFDCWYLFSDYKAKKKSARDGWQRWLQRVRAPPARAGLGACERCPPAVSRAIGPGRGNGLSARYPRGVKSAVLVSQPWCRFCQGARHDAGSVHAWPLGLLRPHQAAINLSRHLGPGQGSQQLPGTHHNPELTFPAAVPVFPA